MNALTDWTALDLSSGHRSRVEASAGTGKTWTLAVLYLRLVLEQGFSPRQIVVATYTNAAAAELAQRLRARLESSLARARRFDAGEPEPSESDQRWLHRRWRDPARRDADARRLALALAELDLAPCGTLHSLCSRILAEHPFAAGASFQVPELTALEPWHAALADDLWRLVHARRDAVTTDAHEAWDAAQSCLADLARAALARELKAVLQPGVVVPAPPAVDEAALWDGALAAALRALAAREGIWNANAALPRGLVALAELIESQGTNAAAFSKERKQLAERIRERTGLKNTLQADPGICTTLDAASGFFEHYAALLESRRLRRLAAMQGWGRAQLDARLRAANRLGFDELLTTVERALAPAADGSRALADALIGAWPVALIDEFQDTDPVQYAVLDAIYREADGTARGHLLMIGDPKQAIYRFRGGDIHTYTRATAGIDAGRALRLSVNYRSSAAFVAAVNAFYAAVGETLGSATSATPIRYAPVGAAPGAEGARYTINGTAAPALVFHRDASEKNSNRELALASCAAQIVALLDPAGGHRIDDRALAASDICVLVPSNADASRITHLLRQRGVAVVNRGRGSVFDGDTARDLCLILDAVARCEDAGRIRAALATELWGTGYRALRALRDDAEAWDAISARFRRWQRDWQQAGVLAVVGALVEQVAADQLARPGGERVLTDLRHLGELLQDASASCDGMDSLLAFMRREIDAGSGDEEAAESRALRLESDARCAQVMTLHASKGLEFGLVFLPLMWNHVGRTPDGVSLLSLPDGSRRIASTPDDLETVRREEQDERYRVLYVALTRARLGAQVWLGRPYQNATGPLAPPLVLAAAELEPPGGDAPAFRIETAWPEAGFRRAPQADGAQVKRRARAMPPPPREGTLPSRHSFTTLTAGAHAGTLDPDAAANDESTAGFEALPEETEAPSRTRHAQLDALAGVAGPAFGNAVHALLEEHRIGEPLAAQTASAQRLLERFAVRDPTLDTAALAERIAARLDAVLETDLDGRGLRLAQVPAAGQRHEMEFNYALDGTSLARLDATARAVGYPDLVPARGGALRGLMNGKIDLVFQHDGRVHVLDWKGNALGDRQAPALEDYAGAALDAAMDAHRYRFQALLYAVAVERYLRTRLGDAYARERHLGDCWYLFIRAVGLRLADGTACGVWRHRFSDALLDAAQRELGAAPGAGE